MKFCACLCIWWSQDAKDGMLSLSDSLACEFFYHIKKNFKKTLALYTTEIQQYLFKCLCYKQFFLSVI